MQNKKPDKTNSMEVNNKYKYKCKTNTQQNVLKQ